jgi:cytochrome c556
MRPFPAETAKSVRRKAAVTKRVTKDAADIQEILNDGKPDDAAKLAADALQQFANTDAAAKLTKLAQQANAVAAAAGGDRKERFARFKSEYEAAAKDKNLRAAALALEQALQNGEDDDLKRKLDDVRSTLAKFDELVGLMSREIADGRLRNKFEEQVTLEMSTFKKF